MPRRRPIQSRHLGGVRPQPGLEQAVGSAETPASYTGAPGAVPHPGAGVGALPDTADHATTGMNSSTGRGRGGGVAGGVAGGHGGTIVSDTNRAVSHERDSAGETGGVAVPFGRGSNLGGTDQGSAADLGGMSGGSLGGMLPDDVAGLEQEQQPGLGGDMPQEADAPPRRERGGGDAHRAHSKE